MKMPYTWIEIPLQKLVPLKNFIALNLVDFPLYSFQKGYFLGGGPILYRFGFYHLYSLKLIVLISNPAQNLLN